MSRQDFAPSILSNQTASCGWFDLVRQDPRICWAYLIFFCLTSISFPLHPEAGAQIIRRSSVLILAPREFERRLKLAQNAVDEKDYAEAIDILETLLHSTNEDSVGEDFFVGKPSSARYQDSLKSRAENLLANLPREAKELYELQFGTIAKRLLAEALKTRDVSKIEEVRRRFFATESGATAAILLGHVYIDTGRARLATVCLEPYVDDLNLPDEKAQELLLLQMIALKQSDNLADAILVATRIADRFPDTKFDVLGKQISVPQDRSTISDWLKSLPSKPRGNRNSAPTEWLAFRGNNRRNAKSDGSLPLLSVRWMVDVANDPADRSAIERIVRKSTNDSTPVIPSLYPLAVGDTILMRGARLLVAVDLRTGKRLWEFPWDETLLGEELTILEPPTGNNQRRREQEMLVRLTQDAIYGQISSDGSAVYLVERPEEEKSNQFGSSVFNRAIPQFNLRGVNTPVENTLIGLDIATEGKYLWRVGGRSGEDEPALAGCFFLGAPLVVEETLYTIAERNGDISLYVLSSKTGRLLWSQQLAHLDPRGFTMARHMRTAGATPSFSNGLLICPTSCGAIVAVDVVNRTLMWGYQYDQTFTANSYSRSRQSQNQSGRWIDSSLSIYEGMVVATPPDSNSLICLDLLTGERKWKKTVKRGSDLFVGCIHDGVILTVGNRQVRGINIETGDEVWRLPFDQQRTGKPRSPTGRGFRTDDSYMLPISGRVLQISIKTGKLKQALETEENLGNLIAYKDQIISLGLDSLTAFYQIEKLSNVVSIKLAANPNDHWALAQKGKLLLRDGKLLEGRQVIRQALDNFPSNAVGKIEVEQSLIEAYMLSLERDFEGSKDLVSELEGTVRRTSDLNRLHLIMGDGYLKTGDYAKALKSYLNLVFVRGPASAIPDKMIHLSQSHSLRQDRSIAVGIRSALQNAPAPERKLMESLIQEKVNLVAAQGSVAELLRCVRFLPKHPAADPIRLQAAQRLVRIGKRLDAEFLLHPIFDSPDERTAAMARILMGELLRDGGFDGDSDRCFREVLDRWASLRLHDGQTAKETIDRLFDERFNGATPSDLPTWPYGETNNRTVNTRQRGQFYRSPSYQDFVRHDVFGGFATNLDLHIDRSDIVATDVFGNEKMRIRSRIPSFRNQLNRFTCTRMGSLAIVNYGDSIHAIDMVGSPTKVKPILWPSDQPTLPINSTPGSPIRPPRKTRWGQSFLPINKRKISKVGAASADGIIYLENKTLKCVDPLTGKSIWNRFDLEKDSEVWGDGSLVFVSAPRASEARVFDFLDGRELGKRSIPSAERNWKQIDRYILTVTDTQFEGKPVWKLRLFDPWEQKDVWQLPVALQTKGYVDKNNLVLLVEPNGKTKIVDVHSGVPVLEKQIELPTDRKMTKVYLLTSKQQFDIAVAFPPKSKDVHALDTSSSIDDGLLFAFNRATGTSMWQNPIEFNDFGIILNQPSELPVILFARKSFTAQSRTNPRKVSRLELVAVDRRDGRQLVELLPETGGVMRYGLSMYGDPTKRTVTLQLPTNRVIQIGFSDQPQPPEPPARIGIRSGDKSSKLGKIFGQIFKSTTNTVIKGVKGNLPAEPKK